ncbi:formate dehydrogenase accessory sulfurtransferase FdhD [Bacillus sp. DTU_2020_1000418_1_SI_GHA_SEK_038]|uniref:formate dehydrogenase accessory sulfurtransferase FdhD n=1 Tax=Bacillus sp. DTU_2020_1000418_1_SI_GHA_SEK_038 TaxID=3077585 RepID=UPI0028E4E539|nr:formate dehydrogenase accessory sulfurtransferase FdhD [Bacillus sp. DTU_2020_1000418_1_SI_GHA_SEK_038]WNS73772.1 formate dehydrogenase accessory sulfurtransferase FdhD [Bacillus sp. DTU_2020_1000418_1_SI_GHA_SEK_038]
MAGQISNNSWIYRYENGMLQEQLDEIVTEQPMTIMLDGQEFATMVCTPENLEELTIGFLASEGIIRQQDEIKSINIDESKGIAYVDLHVQVTTSHEFHSKRFIGSCCGKSRQFYFHNDARTAKTSTSKTTITPDQCLSIMKQLQDSSLIFQETGGVHNAALFSGEEMIISRTDIGRHNALDKIFGYCIQNKIPVKDKIIAFSGRISSEVLLKAAKIGVGIILSKSAPTNLAIKLAEDLNITAVGFIRGNSFNVYSHSYRIID